MIAGLGTDRVFDVELIIAWDLDRSVTVTIGGQVIQWHDQQDGWDAGQTLLFEHVWIDAEGNLAIDIDIAGQSGALNAMRVVEVPEPGRSMLLATGAALLALGRRRPRVERDNAR